jgi:hypothetical protein
MPNLNWDDFYDLDVFENGKMPEGFRPNSFPVAIEVQNNPARIQISLVAEFIDLNFPKSVSAPMIKNFPSKPRFLVWENEHFVWEKD